MTYLREDIGVSIMGCAGARLYGVSLASGHWCYSDDQSATWRDAGSAPITCPGTNAGIQLVFHQQFMILITTDGRLYRAPRDAWAAWADISVPDRPADTRGRYDSLASVDGALLYGNYNNSLPGGAFVWRSTDDGATWDEVLTVPAARHVHCIVADGRTVYATLGDSAQLGAGLYQSDDAGLSWRRIAADRYGINMVVHPSGLLIEGDGPHQPHIIGYADGALQPVITPDPLWQGTARGICLTDAGDLWYISTAEGGAVGTRDGLWTARGPWFSQAVLREDLTGAMWPAYTKTYACGPYLFNYRYRITL